MVYPSKLAAFTLHYIHLQKTHEFFSVHIFVYSKINSFTCVLRPFLQANFKLVFIMPNFNSYLLFNLFLFSLIMSLQLTVILPNATKDMITLDKKIPPNKKEINRYFEQVVQDGKDGSGLYCN